MWPGEMGFAHAVYINRAARGQSRIAPTTGGSQSSSPPAAVAAELGDDERQCSRSRSAST